jgi:heat shock protein HslJ
MNMRLGLGAGVRLNGKLWLCAAVSLLLALAAVSVLAISPEETLPMPKMTASSPVGKVWRWRSLTGAESLDVVHPGRYTLELRGDGRYAVRADCNTGGGAYQMEESRISLSPGPLTRAACAPGSFGDRFTALLARVNGFRVDGDRMVLELGDGAGAMEFEAMKPIALQGTSWLVRGYNNGKGGVVSVGRDATLHLTFTEDGKVTGSSGCNDYKGRFGVVGEQLRLDHIASTRKMCQGEEVMQRESAFLSALASVASWDVRGERLQLRRADGALALDLVAAVTGTVTSSVPLHLPPGAEIRVSLQDISRMDVLATVMGEDVIHPADSTGPIPFQIAFDPAETDPRLRYGVRASIKHQGKLIYTSTRAHPVITRGAPRYGIEIQVEPIER